MYQLFTQRITRAQAGLWMRPPRPLGARCLHAAAPVGPAPASAPWRSGDQAGSACHCCLLSLSLGKLKEAAQVSEWGLSPLSPFSFLLHVLKNYFHVAMVTPACMLHSMGWWREECSLCQGTRGLEKARGGQLQAAGWKGSPCRDTGPPSLLLAHIALGGQPLLPRVCPHALAHLLANCNLNRSPLRSPDTAFTVTQAYEILERRARLGFTLQKCSPRHIVFRAQPCGPSKSCQFPAPKRITSQCHEESGKLHAVSITIFMSC